MAYFSPASGRWVTRKTPKKASTTYTSGGFLANDATNDVPATAQTQQYIRGICLEDVANSSSTTVPISMTCPASQDCTFFGELTTGSLSAANVGACFDFDANSTGLTSTSTYKPVQLVRYLSSTTGIFKLNITTGIEN